MSGMSVHVRDLKGDGQAWVVIYSGKNRRVRKVGDWEEAEQLAAEIRADQNREAAGLRLEVPTRKLLEEHRDGYVVHLKHGTQKLETGKINNHLIPELGDIDVYDLCEADVLAFIEKKLRSYSASWVRGMTNTLQKAHRRYRKAHPDVPELRLDAAEIFSLAENKNAEEIRSINSWTHDEAEELLRIVRKYEPNWYAMVLVLLHTGIRRGEVIGLQWQDVDFKRKRILICRAVSKGKVGPPKHRKASDRPRAVVITPEMEAELRALSTFRYHKSGDWVFATSNGTHKQENTVAKAWNRIKIRLARAGVRPLTLHSLRHTFATLSLESGASIKWVSDQLGHRDVSVTLNTYYHALPMEEADLSYLPGSGSLAEGRNRGKECTS